MDKAPLRLALLINSYSIPAWAFSMLERIIGEGHAQVFLVVRNLSERKSAPFLARAWKFRRYWLYFIYRWIDAKLFRPEGSAFGHRDLRDLLPAVPEIGVMPVERKYSDYFPDDALRELAAHRPDVMIRFGFRILRGEILTLPRYGIWSYHHGDNLVNRGGPPAFWECFLGWDRVGSILQVLTEDLDNGRVIYRSWSGMIWYSPGLTNEASYWKTAAFIPRRLRQLHENGWESVEASSAALNRDLPTIPGPLFRLPGNARMLGLLLSRMPRLAATACTSLFTRNQWFLAAGSATPAKDVPGDLHYLEPPGGHFWADPFLVEWQGKVLLFFEDYVYAKRKAHISMMMREPGGSWSEPVKVLEQPCHLSYPFVFVHDEELYMVPESAENKAIELFRCVSFPSGWERVTTLIGDTEAYDTTLLRYDDRWWLFTTMREYGTSSPNDELFIFSSDDLFSGDWEAHPANPVVSDATVARPAGRIFIRDGQLIRPSQDCGRRYGYAIRFSRITRLTRQEYQEEPAWTIGPDWDSKVRGTHTFAALGDLVVIDAVRKRFRF